MAEKITQKQFEALQSPGNLAAIAVRTFRYHRPTVEVLRVEAVPPTGTERVYQLPFDIDAAVLNVFARRSIDPWHSRDLFDAVTELARTDIPNYDQTMARRIQKVESS